MVSRQSQEPDNPSGPAELPTFVAANGLRLTTEDGRIFLDFASGFESARVEAVQEAITEHLRAAHFHGDAETRFLDDLRTILPAGLSHVHPTRDGSEATEVALSACMRYTGDHNISCIQRRLSRQYAGSSRGLPRETRSGIAGTIGAQRRVHRLPAGRRALSFLSGCGSTSHHRTPTGLASPGRCYRRTSSVARRHQSASADVSSDPRAGSPLVRDPP